MNKTKQQKSKTYRLPEEQLLSVQDMDLSKTYSYADYFSWKIKERVELIKGKILLMTASNRRHQKVSMNLSLKIGNFLDKVNCEVYAAPFDIRFPKKSKKDEEIFDVVQPDLCVICDLSKLDDRGCLGAPDLVVEILSPSSSQRDLKDKYELYETHRVKEYWVVHPEEQTLLIYTLDGKGKYKASKLFARGETVSSSVLQGFELHLADIFEEREHDF